jgi:large subunit ribosomal protein L23
MGLLDRFKKQKEVEVGGAKAAVASDVKKEVSKKTKAAPKAEKKEAPKETKQSKVVRAETARVIISPLITEKAGHLATQNTYVFEVLPKATRTQIASAFRELYGVKAERVNTVKMRAEPVAFGRSSGKQKGRKKAMITIAKGKSIQVYEGV